MGDTQGRRSNLTEEDRSKGGQDSHQAKSSSSNSDQQTSEQHGEAGRMGGNK